MGRSLGAAVATEMATRNLGRSLILITPFSSMNDMFIQKGASLIIVKSSSHGSIYNDFPKEVIARMVSF